MLKRRANPILHSAKVIKDGTWGLKEVGQEQEEGYHKRTGKRGNLILVTEAKIRSDMGAFVEPGSRCEGLVVEVKQLSMVVHHVGWKIEDKKNTIFQAKNGITTRKR